MGHAKPWISKCTISAKFAQISTILYKFVYTLSSALLVSHAKTITIMRNDVNRRDLGIRKGAACARGHGEAAHAPGQNPKQVWALSKLNPSTAEKRRDHWPKF